MKDRTHQYRLGDDLLERISTEKDLGVLVSSRVIMSRQCALVAENDNGTPGCLAWSWATGCMELLYWGGLTWSPEVCSNPYNSVIM